MIRFLIRTAIFMGAAAVGLLVASLLLDDMTIDGLSFLVVVVIFAVLQAILAPFFARTAERSAPALLGGVGLITTWVALIITEALMDGLTITGVTTWVLASLLVWLASMLASLLLPVLFAKKLVQERRDQA